MRYDPLRISLDCNFEWNGCGTSNFALWLYSVKPMSYVLLCILLCMSCSCFVHRCAPLALPSFLHFSLFVNFSLFVSLSLFLLLYFYETILSSSPDPIHFILVYIIRYYCCTRVIILYTCVCIPVHVVISGRFRGGGRGARAPPFGNAKNVKGGPPFENPKNVKGPH